ncbi:hypothetical protein C9374_001082 [Naegleria lovaniensis]|uniref:Uncharacterized protein n=1 Tax=Naegleria lovaniensis TaxID=51637 RepID=A0AA88KHE5_NAELO|nr:uncharacterized protein C9374_013136 [Naegleria lovaniensis]XP_044551480.1 uncharacterized protein C9374_001082 [Naegleria lovaniensis]KAG2372772.1 hypothetical protein C9374_013136 [Naegleria lovaniensis]KAG2387488.1 hypothetical protein C9374_001082 [Naegleria lovaniensis]
MNPQDEEMQENSYWPSAVIVNLSSFHPVSAQQCEWLCSQLRQRILRSFSQQFHHVRTLEGFGAPCYLTLSQKYLIVSHSMYTLKFFDRDSKEYLGEVEMLREMPYKLLIQSYALEPEDGNECLIISSEESRAVYKMELFQVVKRLCKKEPHVSQQEASDQCPVVAVPHLWMSGSGDPEGYGSDDHLFTFPQACDLLPSQYLNMPHSDKFQNSMKGHSYIVVCDGDNQRIKILHPSTGQVVSMIRDDEAPLSTWCQECAVTIDGRVAVADQGKITLWKWNENSLRWIRNQTITISSDQVDAFTVDKLGDCFYCCLHGLPQIEDLGFNYYCIELYSTNSGQFLKRFGKNSRSEMPKVDELNMPKCLLVDSRRGELLLVDFHNYRILVYQ